MSEYIMALDAGKYAVKVIGRNSKGLTSDIQKVNIRTKIYELKNGYIDAEGKSYKVIFNGEELIVGEQGETKSYETSKTLFIHKICTYTAITQFLEPNTKDNKINMVLACPISVLKVEKAKQEYKDFIKGNGTIEINVDDKNYSFEISNIMIKAEGSGIVYLSPHLFKNKKMGVVDFGGLNFTFSLYTDGVCMSPSSDRFVEELGAIKLINYIADDLTGYKRGNIVKFDAAERALDLGYLSNFGEIDRGSQEVIENSKKRFFDEACNEINRHGFRIEELDGLVFIGGTTQKLVDAITNKIPNSFITADPQWSTVEGLYKVAYKKYIT
ncbi:ParM/StbA family protein [Clostridium sp. P21]|uniref:ParM/StbA family protein n=1 Tax=Clostridium muellerianum TaxID=2716538 RepID=A0A7Y0HNK3_9CLOT|nr:ParM/StbA family protein [Clostridium muellerianum]NMM62116.1 ParM/StbA family protein [Clostridium muellerianum]